MTHWPRVSSGRVVAIATLLFAALGLPARPAQADPDVGPPGEPDPGSGQVEVQQEVDVTPARIDGSNRFDTAAITAEVTFDAAATATAVVARGDAFADALAGAAAAAVEDAPILLVEEDEIPERTRRTLDDLSIERVVIVGGEAAVSSEVEADLAADRSVHRLKGRTRYGTAAAVARHLAEAVGIGQLSGDRGALLVSGENFPDALTAGPLAYSRHVPILLTPPDRLHDTTAQALDDLGIGRVLILGGSAAVSSAVESAVRDSGVAVERISGPNRTDTAARFADHLVETWQYSAERPMIAQGDDFPDALAAGPRGGAIEAPILLTRNPSVLSPPTSSWLAERCPAIEAVQAVGGRAAVSRDTLAEAVTAAESCGEEGPERTITYQAGTRGTVHADFDTFQQRARQALNDERGWSLSGEIAFGEVADGGDFRLWLASPQAVENAAPGCSAEWSCRVGDDVYINDERFRTATATYASRSLTAYQWYVINHEVGHWLGLGHLDCPGSGDAAPVMQQQSIDLQGCSANVWPLSWEQDAVRRRWLP